MYDEKIYSLDKNGTYFFGKIYFYFPLISNISLFFLKKHKNVYFPNLFPETELAKSHSPWIFEEFGE